MSSLDPTQALPAKRRRRTAGLVSIFGILAGLSVGAATGCGFGDRADAGLAGNGTGGSSGSSGTGGKSGKGGSKGGGDDDAGGEAGDTTGGMAGRGGMASRGGMAGHGGMAGRGSMGGMGGASMGGVAGKGDICDAACLARCNDCEYCEGDEIYDQIVDLCFNDTTSVAMDGPKIGSRLSELCTDVFECARASRCMGGAAQAVNCYCGASSNEVCRFGGSAMLGDPRGPCVQEIQAAAETRVGDTIFDRITDPVYAVGRAFLALNCERGYCYEECYLNREKDDCERCVIGEQRYGVAQGPPDCLPQAPDQQPYCSVVDNSRICQAIVACGRETGCGRSDPTSCYASGTGPCADEAREAAIDAGLLGVPSTTPPEAEKVLRCYVRTCPTECYGAAGGGAGGLAGRSAGGGGGQ